MLSLIILFLPLSSGVFAGLVVITGNRRYNIINCGLISISAILSSILLVTFINDSTGYNVKIIKWLILNDEEIDFAIQLDSLTVLMFFIITIVSTVVHVYSLGYMHNDKTLSKFIAFLSLFTFFMLFLVASNNFLQLLIGWEGVGLCSYLLIGYRHQNDEADLASYKTFIVNRISDFALILGIIVIYTYTKSFNFINIADYVNELSLIPFDFLGLTTISTLDIICLLLFIGCMGKSAQIGLHVWLPDAIEGPIPVSALIHTATMVTSGVFLFARCSNIFNASSQIMTFIMNIGALTCVYGATVAIAQSNIKKIIAYSTCSQLGYIFLACGAGGCNLGIFHLFAHAFFKALLFLSAGCVIYATNEQNIFKLGGLKNSLPMTYINFWMASLAIIGVYPFAGFYSKDSILKIAHQISYTDSHSSFSYWCGSITIFLTACYSIKIIYLTFHGQILLSSDTYAKIREEKMMTQPLIILVTGVLFSGMLGHYIMNLDSIAGMLRDSLFVQTILTLSTNILVKLLPMIISICSIILSLMIYYYKLNLKLAIYFSRTYNFFKNGYYIDCLYHIIFVKSFIKITKSLSIVDIRIIDKYGPNAIANLSKNWGNLIHRIQMGQIYDYLLYLVGIISFVVSGFLANYYLMI